jgi:hypothetical protein
MASFSRLSRRAVLASAAGVIFSGNAIARRAIPDDNLAYPVLITLKQKKWPNRFWLRLLSKHRRQRVSRDSKARYFSTT